MSDFLPCFDGFDSYYHDNWDGDGARAVGRLTVDVADKLVRSLPPEFHCPAVAPNTKGAVCMEWANRESGNFIWITLGDDFVISITASIGELQIYVRYHGIAEEVKTLTSGLFEEMTWLG